MLAVIAPRCRHDAAPIANSCTDCLKMSRKELFERNFCQLPSAFIRGYKPLLPLSVSLLLSYATSHAANYLSSDQDLPHHQSTRYGSTLAPLPLDPSIRTSCSTSSKTRTYILLHRTTLLPKHHRKSTQIHTNLSQCLHQRSEISSQRMFPSLTSQPPRRLNPSRPVA